MPPGRRGKEKLVGRLWEWFRCDMIKAEWGGVNAEIEFTGLGHH